MKVAGVRGRKALVEGESEAKILQGVVELPLPRERVADLAVTGRQIMLPTRILGVGGCEALGTGEERAIDLERLVELSLVEQQTADSVVQHERAAVPIGIARVGGGKAFGNCQAGTKVPERLRMRRRICRAGQGVADSFVGQ